jgi:hypothetical protein
MASDDDEVGVGKNGLKKPGSDEIGWRFFQQIWPAEIPVPGPLLEQSTSVF